MKNLSFRRAVVADVLLLQEIGQQTFAETFAPHNSVENLNEYLLRAFDEQKLRAELACAQSEIYFIFDEKETVVGYLKINFGIAQTELHDEEAMEIERIYVLAAQQRKQIGQFLLGKAIEIAVCAQKKYIWLGVWEKNEKALAFYQKNSFEIFDQHVFQMGDDTQTDWLMRRVL